MGKEAPSPHTVLGERMEEVESVAVCFRLLWPGDHLAVYFDAAILEPDHRWDESDAGFTERLEFLVSRRLTGVDEILDRGLVLVFEGPTELEISLRDAAEGVADAAEHSSNVQWTRGSLWRSQSHRARSSGHDAQDHPPRSPSSSQRSCESWLNVSTWP